MVCNKMLKILSFALITSKFFGFCVMVCLEIGILKEIPIIYGVITNVRSDSCKICNANNDNLKYYVMYDLHLLFL